MDILVRVERPLDHIAIYDITSRAFAPMPFADGDEQDLIDTLRDAGQLEISLVAERHLKIVGHIAFTPAYAADGSQGWYALGPVSVDPELQRQGIGKKLIKRGLTMLRERKAAGCVLVGNPDYYRQFGFKRYPLLAPEDEPADYFQILPLRVTQPHSIVTFHPLFYSKDATVQHPHDD